VILVGLGDNLSPLWFPSIALLSACGTESVVALLYFFVFFGLPLCFLFFVYGGKSCTSLSSSRVRSTRFLLVLFFLVRGVHFSGEVADSMGRLPFKFFWVCVVFAFI